MTDNSLTDDKATSLNQIEYSRWKASLVQERYQECGAVRCHLGWFKDDGIAVDQSGCDLPGWDRQGIVPRGDEPDCADRLALGVEQDPWNKWRKHLAVWLECFAS